MCRFRTDRWFPRSSRRMRLRINILLGALASSLAFALPGCLVGPNYARPEVEQPAAFKSQPATTQSAPPISPEWWRPFNDPQLNQLIATANGSNQTLLHAVARVDQPR